MNARAWFVTYRSLPAAEALSLPSADAVHFNIAAAPFELAAACGAEGVRFTREPNKSTCPDCRSHYE